MYIVSGNLITTLQLIFKLTDVRAA